ncbi:MAG: ABC transporter ATP-binding protein [Rhodobacteraceae bacterium]|jgi:peptide/nickel transport system ATP-binding protein|nr:ABC transporter ATP-binding protein [Paracoccaceae bacterium]
MTRPVLEIAGLRVAYGDGADVLRGVDLTIAPGETYGLVGESGSGKSTVAYAVQRYLGGGGRITGGRILVDGTDIGSASEAGLRQLRGRRMAMVHQNPATALNPAMRIGRQLAETPRLRSGEGGADPTAAILDVLRRVRFQYPEQILRRWPHQLSGGQLQRVVIAMALLARPALLLLDEPTTGLDATVEGEVASLVREIADQSGGMAILYISHNLGLIARVADRIGVMYAGQIVEEGTARQVLKAPAHPYTRALLASLPGNPLIPPGQRLRTIPGLVPRPEDLAPGCAFAPRCYAMQPGLCDRLMPLDMSAAPGSGRGHVARCLRLGDAPQPPAEAATVMPRRRAGGRVVDVVDLCRSFTARRAFGGRAGRVVAADRVSFAIGKGDILSLVGESGSGKSTIARILTGLDIADSGTAMALGTDIAHRPAETRTKELIAAIRIVFQNPDNTLNPAHRVGRILRRALRRGGRAGSAEEVAALVEAVRLPADAADRRPGALSGGQKQRVAIARAFAGRADLIIADEPVSALDVSVQAAIVELLRDIQAQHGSAILFVSHDLELVRHISDRVVVLYRGTVVEQGSTAQVFGLPRHPYTEMLLAAVHPPDPDHVAPELPACNESAATEAPGLCPFLPRCHRRLPLCAATPPPERVSAEGHAIRCHHAPADLMQLLPTVTKG